MTPDQTREALTRLVSEHGTAKALVRLIEEIAIHAPCMLRHDIALLAELGDLNATELATNALLIELALFEAVLPQILAAMREHLTADGHIEPWSEMVERVSGGVRH